MKQKEPTLIQETKRAAKDRKGRQQLTTSKVNCSLCNCFLSKPAQQENPPFKGGGSWDSHL